MLMRRTGDVLEKSEKPGMILNTVIVLLGLILIVSLLITNQAILNDMDVRRNVESIDLIERRVGWNGVREGLNTGLNGPYGLVEQQAYQERWAMSEYYAERFLEKAYRTCGDNSEADAAAARADKWAAKVGKLSSQLESVKAAFDDPEERILP